ncbi:acetate--CoA ligase family protein [Pseudorhodoferax sp. LjRoot39]|uniref:acetate--CoA ligase family protein n=1 Tax=Pseudorhodoferax sp. LjRoot39 TaxID=3342328 RepID=UPI003ECED786
MTLPATAPALPPRLQPYRRDELLRLLAPRSLAVVGASPRKGSFGDRVLANLTRFDGQVYPVNAGHASIAGLRAYARIEDLPAVPDCAVLAVPRDAVEDCVRACAAAGVGGAIVFASGYAETGSDEGRALQLRLARIAHETGLRIIGPNCMGLANYASGALMSFSSYHAQEPLPPQAIGVVSQSGALSFSLGEAILRGTAFSHLLSAGNSCDVDVADLVAFLSEEPSCRSIVCVLEGMQNPLRLREAARLAWAAGKPLIVHKLATGAEGAAAAVSHTGSLAGSHAAYLALFEDTGAIVAERFEDILEMAAFFAKAPRASAEGVAVISSSGGAAIMAADFAQKHGVPLPQPSQQATATLARCIPDFGSSRNPCDVTAEVINDPASLATCARALLADEVYGTLVLAQPQDYAPAAQRVRMLGEQAPPRGKMACNVLVSQWPDGPSARESELHPHVALFRSMDRCFATLAAWHRRERLLSAPAETSPGSRALPGDAAGTAAALLAEADGQVMGESHAKRLLAAYGIAVTREELVQTSAQAERAAEALGYPVALKVQSPQLPHKTEAGVIRLHLADAQAVRAAYEAILVNARAAGAHVQIEGVVVQQMLPAGLEIMVGARNDPLFGPLVVVGLGGVLVELLKDTVTALAPVGPAQALRMLAGLRGRALLQGFRGAPPVDTGRLADAISRISQLIADHPQQIQEIDVNPLVCGPDGITAVDALVVTRPHPA